MILSTHIMIAGAVTRPIASAHPILLFFVSLASHYLTDLIPHWDYDIRSIPEEQKENPDIRRWNYADRAFWQDLIRFAADSLTGFGVLLFFTRPVTLPEFLDVSMIAVGAIFPDILQAVYFTRKADFLKPFQRLHDRFHTRLRLGPYPLIGIPFQALFFLISLYFLR